jgi:hypothetical protein
VFVVNSRLGLFSATASRSGSKSLHALRLPFSRSYGYNLPSSLTRVLPRTLGCSPRIPVSVYGTGDGSLARSFSRQCGSGTFGLIAEPSASRLRLTENPGLPRYHPSRLHMDFHSHAHPASCVTPLLLTIAAGSGISTGCPSPTLSASD